MRVERLRRPARFGALALLLAAGSTRPPSAEAADAPADMTPFPLTGRQTVRAGPRAYVIDGPQVIPVGSTVHVEKSVTIVGINNASLDVQGELAIHGTQDFWVHVKNVDFSPTLHPEKEGLHIDMTSLKGCKWKHPEGKAFEGQFTIENTTIQSDCQFDVRIASGFLRILTVDWVTPCKVTSLAPKGKPIEFTVQTSWMRDITFSGSADCTIRDSEVKGRVTATDVTEFKLDGLDLFGDVLLQQSEACTFHDVLLQKCNLRGASRLILKHPASTADQKPDQVEVERWFFETGNAGKGLTAEKDVAARVLDGTDDVTQSVRAKITSPNPRKHDFVDAHLRLRVPDHEK